MMLFPLDRMNPGQTADVAWLSDNTSITCRLLDLGFEPGSRVTCVLKKRGGALSAFLVKGAVIALRWEDSSLVFVSDVSNQKMTDDSPETDSASSPAKGGRL